MGVPSGNGSGQVKLPSLVERGRDRIAAQRHLTGDRDGGDPARDKLDRHVADATEVRELFGDRPHTVITGRRV